MGPIIWIDISLDHQKYIGFFLALQGVLWYFAFSILVFGLVKRLFLFYWLSMGLKFFVYLDDAFGSRLQEDFRRPVAFIDRKVLIFPVSLLVRRNPNGFQYK